MQWASNPSSKIICKYDYPKKNYAMQVLTQIHQILREHPLSYPYVHVMAVRYVDSGRIIVRIPYFTILRHCPGRRLCEVTMPYLANLCKHPLV
jgi:hypothetical protein